MPTQEDPIRLSHVLHAEFKTLQKEFEPPKPTDDKDKENEDRKKLYDFALSKLGLAALALSGGGIRSACVALGAIQALAEAKLLKKFHYLSTVSGGGYIGSWLSTWLYWNKKAGKKVEEVLTALTTRSNDPDKEPPPIQHLRAYSSYLTPKLGLTSADTWTAITLVVRNLILNWLILVPAICLVVLSVKIAAGLLHTAVFDTAHIASIRVALVLLVFAGWSLGYKLLRLYPENAVGQSPNAKQEKLGAKNEQSRFLRLSVLPAIVAGVCFAWLAAEKLTPATALAPSRLDLTSRSQWWQALAMAILGVIVFGLLIIVLRVIWRGKFTFSVSDFFAWAFGAATTGAMIWLGVNLFGYVYPSDPRCVVTTRAELVLVVFGLPWFMLSMLMGQLAYVLARSYSPHGDFEREWLARAGGWFIIVTLAWIVLSGLVLLGAQLTTVLEQGASGAQRWLAALGGVGTLSGIATAFLGKSSSTPARGQATSLSGTIANIGLAIAGPLFAAILLILLSGLLDIWVLGRPLGSAAILTWPETHGGSYSGEWGSLAVAVVALIGIMLVADFLVNVNRFSLHATYRNRLIRAFLGGPHASHANVRPPRKADAFTDFDPNDNLRMHHLWDGPLADGDWRPFHVINMTLNLAATKNLAWQQRKAESFTVTPQYCGCANEDLGYRKTEEYGDPGDGISLGTAMAISGAAVSPNMGYHSSPSIAFLLTLLNVRLGWWLGNPGPAGGQDGPIGRIIKSIYVKIGRIIKSIYEKIYNIIHGRDRKAVPKSGHPEPERVGAEPEAASRSAEPRIVEPGAAAQYAKTVPYQQDAPWLSLRPLLTELFGLTSNTSRYVYLSDGGHFENLGIYEMVRRRCRWIVVSDAGADPDRGFEDLGNAVRKIWIDLGVRIIFEKSDLLLVNEETKPIVIPYCALGTIEYLNDGDGRATGKILYVKPVVRGDEPAADIIAYLRAHEKFPHQSTAEQWFDEPQLESYRVLGYWMTKRIVESTELVGPVDTLAHFL